jgi:hypothetical protein
MRYDPERDLWSPLSVRAVASLLQDCPARWWLSGGWAIDHWLGTVTRSHGDIDVSTLRPELPTVLGSLPGHLEPFAAVDGYLHPLTSRVDDSDVHNVWLRDERCGRWVFQVNVEAGDQGVWRYRRDPRIALPWERAVRCVSGVPTGFPAVQLLWKSPRPRPEDDADLASALKVLSAGERHRLAEAMRTAHPCSPWVPQVPPLGADGLDIVNGDVGAGPAVAQELVVASQQPGAFVQSCATEAPSCRAGEA